MNIFVPRLALPTNANKYYIKSPDGHNPCILGNSANRHPVLNTLCNCFAGETEYVTDEGLKTFIDTVGTTQNVLNENGEFVPAEIKEFGIQKLYKITFGNSQVVYATGNHRWVVENARKEGNNVVVKRTIKTTEELLVKTDNIPYNYAKCDTELDKDGILHGLVFGGGTAHTNCETYKLQWFTKDKQELEQYVTRPIKSKYDLKKLPPLTESNAYLRGFVAGWLATDGTVTKDTFNIRNVEYENIKGLETICYRLGIHIGSLSSETRDKKIGKYEYPQNTMYCLSLKRKGIETLLLKSSDKKKIKEEYKDIKYTCVKSIEETDRVEKVYCAVEPITHTITLKNNLLTGQCVGYATGRFNEIIGAGNCQYLGNTNACNFYKLAQSQGLSVGTTPKLGACIVWAKDGAAGHVAIVESVISETEIQISESGWSSKSYFWTARHRKGSDGNWTDGGDSSWMKGKYQFLGFVYNPAVTDDTYPQLKKGMVSYHAKLLQQLLNKVGTPNLEEDGAFGQATDAAVRAFQTSRKLVSDGVVGAATWQALLGAEADTKKPDGVNDLIVVVNSKQFRTWSTNINGQNYIRVADLPALGLAKDVGWDNTNKRVIIKD